LNQELGEIEQEATQGENLLRQLMSLFSNNASLIQFFAYFQTTRFFVVNASRRRIRESIEKLSTQQIDTQVMTELEDQVRKVYQMSEAFAQKYEQRLENQSTEEEQSIIQTILNE
jgi:hypothetical protein